jgi:uncharacterized membrane protein
MDLGALHLLRLVHVVTGVFWVGAVIFLARFLFPAVVALGPAGGPVMEQVVGVRKASVAITGATVLSLLSGIALYWRDSGGFSGPWMRTGTGMTFGIGGLFAILAAVYGVLVNKPLAERLAGLGAEVRAAGRPPTAEQQTMIRETQGKLQRALVVVTLLLLLATSAMAVARYVP